MMAVLCRAANPRPQPVNLSTARSLLVVKLDDIGDFVLATPFLRELRRNAPQATITLVVKRSVSNLAESCPHVNGVLTFDGQAAGGSAWLLRRHWRALSFARRHLRPQHFDVAVIPRWDVDPYLATALAAFAGARAVVGFSDRTTALKRAHNRGFDRLLTDAISPEGHQGHEVNHNLSLLTAMGGTAVSTSLELWLTDDDHAIAAARLPERDRYVAIATGAAETHRRWSANHFARLALTLRDRYSLTAVLLGEASDPAVAGAIDFRGQTTLRQAAAMLKRCHLFVGNDSGVKHLAAAVGTSVVEISGFRAGGDPNHNHSPTRFHAWGVPQRVVQPAAGRGDFGIEDVSVAAVEAAVAEMLRKGQS